MLKLLRRYNKIILMVGGSILMVLFLLPTTVTQMRGNPLAAPVAYVDGKKWTVKDLQSAAEEMRLIEEQSPGFLQTRLGIDPRQPEHWLLLVHEAREAGLVGGPSEARKDLLPEVLTRLQAQIPEALIDRTFINLHAITRLMNNMNPGAVFSTREAVEFGQRIFDSALVDLVVIPADQIGAGLPEPSEDRLAAHFEKYRDTDPEQDEFAIGYRRPNAVRLEWFSIDRGVVEAAYTPDPIAVRKYFTQNQSKYTGQFAAVRSQVEADFKKSEVDQVLARVADLLKRELFKSTSGLPADGSYKRLPEDWASKMPRLEALAQLAEAELQKQFPDMPKAVAVTSADSTWRSAKDIDSLPGLAFAFVDFGTRGRARLSDYLMQAREFKGIESLGVQAGMVLGPISDFRGASYYVRIVETREEGPPPSMDEVRTAVINDVRMLEAVEQLRQQQETYIDQAASDGIKKLAETVGQGVRAGLEVTWEQLNSFAGGQPDRTLNHPELRQSVIHAARSLDPKTAADTQDAKRRTVASIVPGARGLAVAQITQWRPMTIEKFRSGGDRIAALAARSLGTQRTGESFSYEMVRARHKVEFVGEEEKPAPQNSPGAPGEAAPASGN